MTTNSKIVIIGGGPAGFASGIFLAKNKFDVTLVEQTSEIVEKPGEIFHPGIEPILKELGVLKKFKEMQFLQHDGNLIKWNGESFFQAFNEIENWKGFQIERKEFDSMLFEAGKNSNLRIINSCKVISPILEKGKIIEIKTNQKKIALDMLIDATGRNHWLAKQLKIPIEQRSEKIKVHFGYMKGRRVMENPVIESTKDGWKWIAKIHPDIIQWIRLSFENNIPNDWIPEELKNLKQYGITRKMDMTWRIVSKPVGSNYFMVGDAAFVLDPASSHGVLRALMSGMMAAHLILKTQENQAQREQVILEYSKWIKEWFEHDANKLKEFYKKHPNPPKWVLNQTTKNTEDKKLLEDFLKKV